MQLLLIGGTGFLGRHIVEAALAHGHTLTLFNRGKRDPELFPQVEQLHGDRDGDLAALQDRHWDVVIDTCGYFPRTVGASAQALASFVDRYIFISSISVYADFLTSGMDESFPVAKIQDESVEEITNESYGALKALCEQAVEKAMPGRVLVIRPGLIVGPHDRTDRFTYWPWRVARGGEMLVPGTPDQHLQFIDVRDLADWTLRMAEARKTGTYNATGPDYQLSTQQLVDQCKSVTGSDVRYTWVDESLISDDVNLQPWAPRAYAGINEANCSRAIQDGLTFRPLAETIRATLAWKGQSDELHSGLKPDQEQQLLQKWQASR